VSPVGMRHTALPARNMQLSSKPPARRGAAVLRGKITGRASRDLAPLPSLRGAAQSCVPLVPSSRPARPRGAARSRTADHAWQRFRPACVAPSGLLRRASCLAQRIRVGSDRFRQPRRRAPEIELRKAWRFVPPGGSVVPRKLRERRGALDRYLRAFESGDPPPTRREQRVRELDREDRGPGDGEGSTRGPACHRSPLFPRIFPRRHPSIRFDRRSRRRSRRGIPSRSRTCWPRLVDEIVVESRACIQPYFTPPGFVRLSVSGGGRESNPPGSFRPLTGFEDRGAHQAPGRLRLPGYGPRRRTGGPAAHLGGLG
jgi:hypothetical protein